MGQYTQLTQGKRYHIYALMKAGFSQTDIAKEIGVHKSTICRELEKKITERKKVQDALQNHLKKSMLLAQYSRDIICLHEPDGKYKYVSSACKKMLGYEPEGLIGKDPYEPVHSEDIEGIQKESYERVLKGEHILIKGVGVRESRGGALLKSQGVLA